MSIRSVRRTFNGKSVTEGAGVHLKRVFGYYEIPQFDPFLMLDDFRNDDPEKYIRGFPWHPHRGIETITYMLDGKVEHKDSLGNTGILSAGDVQWMTAGRGIIHQEMPEGSAEGKMHGFQIWANLPASHKMMAPRYQDIPARDIPEVIKENGVRIRVLCGEVDGVKGPVRDIVIDPEFLDITVPPHIDFIHPVKQDYTAFFYCIDGNGFTGTQNEIPFHNTMLILFEDGAQVVISTKDEPARVLFISGKPLREPIAWGGPIVMNTREELQQAFRDYESGTFK